MRCNSRLPGSRAVAPGTAKEPSYAARRCTSGHHLEQEGTNTPAAIYYDSKYAAKITTGEYKAETNKYLAVRARTLLRQVWETTVFT